MKEALVDKIIDYEAGLMTDEEVVRLFQELYDDDVWKTLRGHYTQVMTSLINEGRVQVKEN